MTKEEVYKFIAVIGNDYDNFNPSQEEARVWVNELADKSKETIYLKYEEHKKNEDYKKYPPKLDYFIYDTKAKIQTEYLMKCRWCGKVLYDKAMIKHEDRHRDIEYIEKNIKEYFGKEIENKRELVDMQDNEFDKKMYEFTKKLLPKMENSYEKRCLTNYVYLTNHPEEVIAPNGLFESFKEMN